MVWCEDGWSDVINGAEWCNKEPILVGREPIIYMYVALLKEQFATNEILQIQNKNITTKRGAPPRASFSCDVFCFEFTKLNTPAY